MPRNTNRMIDIVRTNIVFFFQIVKETIQSLIIKCDVDVDFFIAAIIKFRKFTLDF